MMTNAFYFMLKALFVLVLALTFWLRRGRKLKLVSKFMTSQTRQQLITIT